MLSAIVTTAAECNKQPTPLRMVESCKKKKQYCHSLTASNIHSFYRYIWWNCSLSNLPPGNRHNIQHLCDCLQDKERLGALHAKVEDDKEKFQSQEDSNPQVVHCSGETNLKLNGEGVRACLGITLQNCSYHSNLRVP